MNAALLLSTLLCPAALLAALAPKADYQPIIDAKPFGDMAALADTDTASLAEQQKQKEALAQKFRMCGITDMPDGTRKIAFLDETSGQVASYLLAVGETQNGFTLVSADYAREYATLTKDGLTLTLGLGKGLIDAPPEAEEGVPTEVGVPLPQPVADSAATAPTPPHRRSDRGGRGSFRSRLLQRQAAKEEAEASERRALQNRVAEAEAEKVKAARRVQIERIKQGLAPTQPITLTPEEDAELEAAGAFRAPTPQNQPKPAESDPKPDATPAQETPTQEPSVREAVRRAVAPAAGKVALRRFRPLFEELP